MTVHKHSKLISQFARMVEVGHDINKIVQYKDVFNGWSFIDGPSWDKSIEYRVALAFVEGKPVFEGDILYSKMDLIPRKIIVDGVNSFGKDSPIGFSIDEKHLSWNKPEEKKDKQITYVYSIVPIATRQFW